MKKYLVRISVVIFVSISWLMGVQAEERKVTHNLELSDPNKPALIEVSLMQGKVNVEGYKGKTVEIVATVRELSQVRSSNLEDVISAEIVKSLEREEKIARPSIKGLKKVKKTNVNVNIEERNNKVSIESHSSRQNIELSLRVPFNSNLELAVNKGKGIFVNNVYGNIEIESARGPISAKGVKGSIVAESARSDLTVVFDEFNLKKPSSLTVHRGNIDVTLPKKASVNIEVKNYEGEIYSGLNTKFESIDKVEKGSSRGHQQITIGGSMQAKVNGGKQKLLLNTFRGDMFIRNQ